MAIPGIEIERKFLLQSLPHALAFARRAAMPQGYLAVHGDTEVPARRTGAGSKLPTNTSGGGMRTGGGTARDPRRATAPTRARVLP